MSRSVRAYVGLGANVGDARATLRDAVAALAAVPGLRVAGVSRLYRTLPVGVTDQPDFLNAVVALVVDPAVMASADRPAGAVGAATERAGAAEAIVLLVRLKDIERAFGRRRRRRWGPRELDLDLLLYGDAALAIDRPPDARPLSAATDPAAAARLLEVPHPAMADRLFVLAPLADLAPDLVPPGWHDRVATAAARLAEREPDAVTPLGAWNLRRGGWDALRGDSAPVSRG